MPSTESLAAITPLAELPRHSDRRLIDAGLFHYEASLSGFLERYRRGETPHTIHVWWARRPHTAIRALLFACLVADDSPELFETMKLLSISSEPRPFALQSAKVEISKHHRTPPKILDMFGGGGTIASEATLLGLNAHSIDSNQLSVFLQRSLLEFSQVIPNSKLVSIVQESGKRVLEQLHTNTSDLFPSRGKTFGYIWTYSIKCPQCKYRFYLSKRPWLSKKNGRRVAFVIKEETDCDSINIESVSDSFEHQSVWIGRRGITQCPRCNATSDRISIKNCRDEFAAAIDLKVPSGKTFRAPASSDLPSIMKIKERETTLLATLNAALPRSQLPKWSGIINPALYGIETHADFLNPRQRLVLLSLIGLLKSEYEFLKQEHGPKVSTAVISLLSGLVDQLIDWNCRLSMWIPQNEQVGRAFSGPGVAMLWDYAEIDPLMRGPANLWSKLERIVAGCKSLGSHSGKVEVQQAIAQQLPFPDRTFDAIVTDPPYYDNIYYNALADFFFSWKRLVLEEVVPDLFGQQTTNDSDELVASKFRSGSKEAAHTNYCNELSKAIGEAERVLKTNGIFSLLYSHSSLKGWEAVVVAYRKSRLVVTSVQPLSIERKARPRAMTSTAINTCVVFVARKSKTKKVTISPENFYSMFRENCGRTIQLLRSAGWADSDAGIAAFAQCVGMLSNVSNVANSTDVHCMEKCASIVRENVASFEVSSRSSL